MQKIFVEKIKVFGYHGCLDEEKKSGQYFLISLELTLKSGFFDSADDVAHTINYADVCKQVETIVADTRFNLLESLAETIAQTLLLTYPGLDSVKAAVEKPEAPVDVQFLTLGVTAYRAWHTVFLSLGSNLKYRKKNIRQAIKNIISSSGCMICACSEIIETEPWGVGGQPKFLNCALKIKTLLEPPELLHLLKKIERDMGRVAGIKWGPRIIDIDVLLYDSLVYSTDDLQIPHPYMHERKFVLGPLAEIAPNAIHPVKNRSIRELLDQA